MTRRTAPLVVLCALLALVQEPAQAQQRECCQYNDFSMEPFAGAFFDDVDDGSRETGPLLGVRLAYEPLERVRLVADIAYSEISGAGVTSSGTSIFTYGSDWIFLLGGFEFDVVPGATAGSISLAAGAGWRQNEIERRVTGTDAEPALAGFQSFGVIAPGVSLRQTLSPRAAVRLGLQDYIVDFGENPRHSPALTLGVIFR